MQTLIRRIEETTQIARRLTKALFVFDQRETQVTFAMLAEAFARRDSEIGFLDQQF